MKELVIRWTTEDVLGMRVSKINQITQEEAELVLDLQDRHHDCEMGVSWETLQVCVQEIVDERNK